jgi:hypothetical protein
VYININFGSQNLLFVYLIGSFTKQSTTRRPAIRAIF